MLTQLQSRLQDNSALRQAALALLALGVGVLGGLAVVAGNPLVPFVALAALLAMPWLVTRPMADIFLVVATVLLLPYAALPVRLAVLTPTLLEVGLLLLYAAWLLYALLNPGEGLIRTPLDIWVVLFLGSTLFAFVLGLARDSSSDVVHNYFKLLLSIGLFFAAASIIRTPRRVRLVYKSLIALGGLEALTGLALWRLPDSFAGSLLTRLSVVGYPTDRVIRYIEDNPALGERAVGTQVDPNSFAGLLIVIVALTGVALLARKPVLPRWLLAFFLLADVATLVLTASRAALLGVLAAAALIATLRYRHLWVWGVVGAVLLVMLGLGTSYLNRLLLGLQFQDPANLMRLAEYRNALDIISRYPVFGVGFGTAGELDLTTGVSSIYLTIGERAGLVGLVLFALAMIAFFVQALPAIVASRRRAPAKGSPDEREWSGLDSVLLGGTAAVLGVLVAGVADHYYFNIEFPHMAALLWLTIAVVMVAIRLTKGEQRDTNTNPEA